MYLALEGAGNDFSQKATSQKLESSEAIQLNYQCFLYYSK